MRRIGGVAGDGGWVCELTATIVSRSGGVCPCGGRFGQRVSTVTSSGDSNIATGEITGSSIGTLSP